MNRVHERLEQEAARRGTTDRLARLRPFLEGSEPEGTYAAIAREWGVGEPAVRVALHRLRQTVRGDPARGDRPDRGVARPRSTTRSATSWACSATEASREVRGSWSATRSS